MGKRVTAHCYRIITARSFVCHAVTRPLSLHLCALHLCRFTFVPSPLSRHLFRFAYVVGQIGDKGEATKGEATKAPDIGKGEATKAADKGEAEATKVAEKSKGTKTRAA
jgi:hypothetical protein